MERALRQLQFHQRIGQSAGDQVEQVFGALSLAQPLMTSMRDQSH